MHNSSEGELKSCVRKHIQIVGRGNINALLKGTCLVHGGEGSRVGESPVQHCHVEGDRCVSCCWWWYQRLELVWQTQVRDAEFVPLLLDRRRSRHGQPLSRKPRPDWSRHSLAPQWDHLCQVSQRWRGGGPGGEGWDHGEVHRKVFNRISNFNPETTSVCWCGTKMRRRRPSWTWALATRLPTSLSGSPVSTVTGESSSVPTKIYSSRKTGQQ